MEIRDLATLCNAEMMMVMTLMVAPGELSIPISNRSNFFLCVLPQFKKKTPLNVLQWSAFVTLTQKRATQKRIHINCSN